MTILGISAFYHDSAAVVIRDGQIVAAAQEERFTRHKGDSDFPSESVAYCLREAGLTDANDLDEIVFYDKPIQKFDRILASYIHRAPLGFRSFVQAVPLWLKSKLWTADVICKELKYKKDILFTEHHQSHAASAFFPSPFQDAAVLTVDGAGEWTTTTIGVGEGNRVRLLKKMDFPHSLGLLYSAFTYYCGFRVNSGEYKLMGLAPYGQPKYLDLIEKELVKSGEDGSYILNEKYFNYISGLKMINRKFEKLFGRKALPSDGKPDQFYMDIAASIQEYFNKKLVELARAAKKLTGKKNLCIAGGVGLNCVANARIAKEAGFDSVWIQPAAGDAGAALGAALYVYYHVQGNARNADGIHDAQRASLLGPAFSDDEIRASLNSKQAVYQELSEPALLTKVASAIASGKVVGWVQGRMEFGPRALGSRSILGDPRSTEMQSVMNLKIKFRESFRPFAPSVLLERVADYFDWQSPSPYMLMTAPVKESIRLKAENSGLFGIDLLKVKRSEIPAITHVDYSARLQTVSEKDNPRYYRLLKEFERQTGCGLLINTSFNVRGEPIVCTPVDAYRCFMGTGMDVLVVGSFYMAKEEQPETEEIKAWKKTLIRD